MRIKINIEDIEIVRPCNNKVLVKIEEVTGKSKSGLIVGLADWDEAGHVTRSGEVVRIPNKLFHRGNNRFGIEWETNIEIKKGDIVYWGIMEGSICPVLICGSDKYYLVDYSELRISKRGEEIIPLNGYVIVEAIEETERSSVLITEHTKKVNKKKGRVVYSGSSNLRYFPEPNTYYDPELNVGDEVLFSISAWTPLEDKRYALLDKKLGYCQKRWVIAKTN